MKHLPKGVKYYPGFLYTKENSDLFIDDLTPNELRMIADHLEEQENIKKDKNQIPSSWNNTLFGY